MAGSPRRGQTLPPRRIAALLRRVKYTLGQTSFVPGKGYAEKYSGNTDGVHFYRAVLKKRGVPDGAVLGEDKAEYTMRECEIQPRFVRQPGYKRAPRHNILPPSHAAPPYQYYTMSFPKRISPVCPRTAAYHRRKLVYDENRL